MTNQRKRKNRRDPRNADTPTFFPTILKKALPPPPPIPPTHKAAARFLAQATFGATDELIDEVVQLGYAAWLDQQRDQPISRTRPYMDQIRADLLQNNLPAAQLPYQRAENPTRVQANNFSTAWMRNIVFGSDHLRQRVAWALSQILVVSFQSENLLAGAGAALADYYDTLATHALGNFRELLLAVSLHPIMAHYLSSLGNQQADSTINRYPDENYARELMQLFTIGLWELNPDGTPQLDAQHNPIPTYANQDVEELARVFTGLWFDGLRLPQEGRRGYRWEELMDLPLVMVADRHDQGAKVLFHGKPWETHLPANNGGQPDIAAALDTLVRHPNCAPFISRALIQFLVTSNPSPAYVQRVAEKFVDNGAGERGDLFAVVKTILLDDEARNLAMVTNPKHGKLQEPMVRLTRLVRAFDAGKTTPDLQFWYAVTHGENSIRNVFLQWPLASPSVFNFFSPHYRHLGVLGQNGLVSPEFQILNAVTVTTTNNQFANFIDTLLHKRLQGGTPEFAFDFRREYELAVHPSALVDRLDLLLCNGLMAENTRQIILDGIEQLPEGNPDARIRLAVWLAAVSPDGAILR